MLTEKDSHYLTQGSMQSLLCLLGSKCFCELLVQKVNYAPAQPAVEHLKKAVEEMDAAYRIFVEDVEQKQIDRLAKHAMSHHLAMIPECDPLLKKIPVIMDWKHVVVLVDALNNEVCTLCDRDKDGVRNCPIREAIYDMGGEPDVSKAKINEWCEMSRGIL